MADNLYHTGKESWERLDNPAVFVCLLFGLLPAALGVLFWGLSWMLPCVFCGGKVEKEEVIPKTMAPGPTQDGGSWPTALLL